MLKATLIFLYVWCMAATPEQSRDTEPKTIDELAQERAQQEQQDSLERISDTQQQEQQRAQERREQRAGEQAQEQAREQVQQAEQGDQSSTERERIDADASAEAPAPEGDVQKRKKGGSKKASHLPKDLEDDVFLKEFFASDRPQQVKTLVAITLKKGVRHAVQLAKSSKDPYLMDIFHDTLVDEFHGRLDGKGKNKDGQANTNLPS